MLNRAEWVKFFALFFNKEAEANAEFSRIREAYYRYSKDAQLRALTCE